MVAIVVRIFVASHILEVYDVSFHLYDRKFSFQSYFTYKYILHTLLVLALISYLDFLVRVLIRLMRYSILWKYNATLHPICHVLFLLCLAPEIVTSQLMHCFLHTWVSGFWIHAAVVFLENGDLPFTNSSSSGTKCWISHLLVRFWPPSRRVVLKRKHTRKQNYIYIYI